MRKRRLYISLCSVMLAVSLQISSFAATAPSRTEESMLPSLSISDIITEDIAAREERVKCYSNTDGSHFAAVYSDPIHYQDDNGAWKEIDNTLSLVSSSTGNLSVMGLHLPTEYYQNTSNSFRVQLPKNLTIDSTIRVQHEEYSIGFRMCDIDANAMVRAQVAVSEEPNAKRDALVAEANSKANAGDGRAQQELLKEAAVLVANQSSSLKYSSVLDYTDLEYCINGQELKESIILERPTDKKSYSFELFYSDLTPIVQEHGAVFFYAEQQEYPVFTIQPPYMEDSGTVDALCTDIDVSVIPTETGCIYTITPNETWLQDSARVYPICIDPSITTSTAATDIQDSGVNQYNPTTNYWKVNRMYVGSNVSNGVGYESRIYIRFPKVAAIGTNAYITSATMWLNHHPTTSYQTAENNELQVFDVGGYNWNASTITWNSQAGYTFSNVVAGAVTNKSNSSESFDITDLVRKWYGTAGSNNGVVIKPKVVYSDKTNRTCYLSSDYSASEATKRPRVVINYDYGTVVNSVNTPSDGGGYFLRNLQSGNYLAIPSGVDNNNKEIRTVSFKGTASQRWRVVMNSNGTFRLQSGLGSFSRYVNVSNSAVNLYSNNTAQQTFSLVRYGSTNLFYIKHGGKFISQKPDGSVFVSNDSWGAFSLWSFESVFAMMAPLYPKLLRNPVPAKYKASKNTTMKSENHAINLIRASRVFISNCHGSFESIDAGNGLYVTSDMMKNLPANDLRGVKVIVYISCETGKGGASADNFVNATYNKGAQAVIGFKESIGEIGDNWGDGFMAALCAGKTIREAISAGDAAGKEEWGSYENIQERTERGNLNATVLE